MHPGMQRAIEILPGARAPDGGALEDEQRNRQQRDRRHLLVNVLGDGIDRRCRHERDHEQRRHRAERKRDRHSGKHHQQCRGAVEQPDRQHRHGVPSCRRKKPITCSSNWMLSSVIPVVINEYGIHKGGAQVEPEWKSSTQASSSNIHDFHAKKLQNARLARSTRSMRMRLARGDSSPAIASMPTWPRGAWIAADDMNTAPTIRKTESSSCQSVEK